MKSECPTCHRTSEIVRMTTHCPFCSFGSDPNGKGLQKPSVLTTGAARDAISDIKDILAEVASARANWPPFNSAHEGFAVLLEEVDELKAHVWTNQKRRDLAAMRNEAKQVAAMAIRFMQECCSEETGRK